MWQKVCHLPFLEYGSVGRYCGYDTIRCAQFSDTLTTAAAWRQITISANDQHMRAGLSTSCDHRPQRHRLGAGAERIGSILHVASRKNPSLIIQYGCTDLEPGIRRMRVLACRNSRRFHSVFQGDLSVSHGTILWPRAGFMLRHCRLFCHSIACVAEPDVHSSPDN